MTPITTMSGKIDAMFWFMVALTVCMSGLIISLMVVFSVIYRKRPGHERSRPLTRIKSIEAVWIGVPLIVFVAIFIWGAKLYMMQRQVPREALQIFCVAKQWMWKFQHPEGKREIDQLHVPVGVPVHVTLISEDVIHGFFVPDFRVKMDVLPGRYTDVWFNVSRPGEYQLVCSQYCGANHSKMRGTIVAMSRRAYEAWMQKDSEMPLSLKGKELFSKYGCMKCHEENKTVEAPPLEGIYGQRVALADGRAAVADEPYLRESILYPSKDIVSGYRNIMPPFKNQLNEEETIQLIAYIEHLSSSGDSKR